MIIEEINFYWTEIIKCIEKVYKDMKVLKLAYDRAVHYINDMKIKRGTYFNYYLGVLY